jgi:hypothetical protein
MNIGGKIGGTRPKYWTFRSAASGRGDRKDGVAQTTLFSGTSPP